MMLLRKLFGYQPINAQDNSVASRTMDLRVATATSKATATRSIKILSSPQRYRVWDRSRNRIHTALFTSSAKSL